MPDDDHVADSAGQRREREDEEQRFGTVRTVQDVLDNLERQGINPGLIGYFLG